ncbi:restriction endonuclease subunit S [Rhodoglobus aureus]|uniref:restriction endonuclease subunit S n=1 Tax=Rhodoglobus aureus TaxID=191497 RepID=UPI0031DE4819
MDDQQQISKFLDVQTTKIDALISKQEQLIETLAERRQAVISHAVTKGLDPDAPMTDVAAKWVERIPVSWNMKRVSWLFGTVGSGTTPTSGNERYYGEGTPWVTTGELRETTILSTAKSVTGEALSNFSSLRVYGPGTLLIAMYGATIGRLGELGISACTNQACCAMAEPQGVLPRFVHYSLLAAKPHILVLAVGGGQPNINQEVIRALRLPTPGITEQQEIVDFLNRETSQIDGLSAKAREMIVVLKERRQALISAAVTGKIDVRGLS